MSRSSQESEGFVLQKATYKGTYVEAVKSAVVVIGVCVCTVNSTYVAISAILLFCHSFRRTAIPAIPSFRHSTISAILLIFRHSAIPQLCHSAIPPFYYHSAILHF